MIRPQYHFRTVGDDTLIWDVRKLIDLSASLPEQERALDTIAEVDEAYRGGTDAPLTCRDVLQHGALIEAADTSYPILLCAEGRVMDGMHRVLKALKDGQTTIRARQFPVTPEPDFKNIPASDLDYEP